MKLRILLIVYFISFTSAVQAEWTRSEQVCVFRNPLYIGASLTAATPRILLLWNEIISVAFGAPYHSMGVNPGSVVAQKYRGAFLERKLARHGSNRVKKISHGENLAAVFASDETHSGTYQIKFLLDENGENRSAYEKASIIFGIDLFYWDAVWDTCGNSQLGVEYQIERLIESAKEDGKTLILGTVPYDEGSKVFIDSERVGIDGLWYQPTPSCVSSINDVIRNNCKEYNNCYIIDLERIVSHLYSGESVDVRGVPHDLHSLRPDGVHLSETGTIFLADKIISMLESHPPSCTSESLHILSFLFLDPFVKGLFVSVDLL